MEGPDADLWAEDDASGSDDEFDRQVQRHYQRHKQDSGTGAGRAERAQRPPAGAGRARGATVSWALLLVRCRHAWWQRTRGGLAGTMWRAVERPCHILPHTGCAGEPASHRGCGQRALRVASQ